MDLLIPISPFLHGRLSKGKSLSPPHLTKLIHSEFIFEFLGLAWIFHERNAGITCSVERGNKLQRHRITVQSQPVNKAVPMDYKVMDRQTSHQKKALLEWPLATLVPLTSEGRCANKKGRGSLAFFSSHVCFENTTCIADYMIITPKSCQGFRNNYCMIYRF